MPDGLNFSALPKWCVFTAPDVVRRALDAINWVEEEDLSLASLLEPAAGDGAFVAEAARRLLASLRKHGKTTSWEVLGPRMVAFEIEKPIAKALRQVIADTLAEVEVEQVLALRVAQHWCREVDFLTADVDLDFTHAVGNPPFRRSGGAGPDACVGFVAKSFELLRPDGRMAMLAPVAIGSATGAACMRELIDRRGSVEAIESYEPASAFVRKVSVRGALFVIRRDGDDAPPRSEPGAPWLAGSADACTAFAAAAKAMPKLESAGCRVRLGVATGCNSVFVRRPEEFDIEEDLLVPAVATRDLGPSAVEWRGLCLIDTSDSDGRPWAANARPRLSAYLDQHRARLLERHSVECGSDWRLTHTRIDRQLAAAEKVLIAETANPCRVALDRGGHMPLNSVHAVTSLEWPLTALHAILASGAVGLLANALLLRRGGGHLRVNATALRQVRIPAWRTLTGKDRENFSAGDFGKSCETTARIFKISDALLRQCIGETWS